MENLLETYLHIFILQPLFFFEKSAPIQSDPRYCLYFLFNVKFVILASTVFQLKLSHAHTTHLHPKTHKQTYKQTNKQTNTHTHSHSTDKQKTHNTLTRTEQHRNMRTLTNIHSTDMHKHTHGIHSQTYTLDTCTNKISYYG